MGIVWNRLTLISVFAILVFMGLIVSWIFWSVIVSLVGMGGNQVTGKKIFVYFSVGIFRFFDSGSFQG